MTAPVRRIGRVLRTICQAMAPIRGKGLLCGLDQGYTRLTGCENIDIHGSTEVEHDPSPVLPCEYTGSARIGVREIVKDSACGAWHRVSQSDRYYADTRTHKGTVWIPISLAKRKALSDQRRYSISISSELVNTVLTHSQTGYAPEYSPQALFVPSIIQS